MLNLRQETLYARHMLRLMMLSSTVIASGLVAPAFAQTAAAPEPYLLITAES